MDCSNLTYCEVSGAAEEEWIAIVQLNTIDNTTTSDNGYGDYSSITTTVLPGSTHSINLAPGYSGFQFSEYFIVWIDFDASGDFDLSEVVFDSGQPSNQPVSGSVTIPADAQAGAVRMRVAMDYYTSGGGGDLPVSCGSLSYGEAEDYCILIDSPDQIGEKNASNFAIFPNPVNNFLAVQGLPANSRLAVLDMNGREVLTRSLNNNNEQIDVTTLAEGMYMVRISNEQQVLSTQRIVVQH
jgi:hypothetical protein